MLNSEGMLTPFSYTLKVAKIYTILRKKILENLSIKKTNTTCTNSSMVLILILYLQAYYPSSFMDWIDAFC